MAGAGSIAVVRGSRAARRFWGLSAQEDQALAGAIMAIEQSLVMGIALAYLFVKLLADSDKEEERAERFAQ